MIRVRGFPTSDGGIDLDVAAGEVVLLRGPNGCGKTSLLRALAGLPGALVPDAATIDGDDPRALPAHDLAARLGLVPQHAHDALAGLTVRGEARLRGAAVPSRVLRLADRDVATLSSGEARAVALALADAAGAPLLLLDEPAEGLDAEGRARLADLVRDARARGAAVVAVDHGGTLAPFATRAVDLAPSAPAVPLAAPPAPHGPPLLRAPARRVRRGGIHLALPETALPVGLHVAAGPNGCGKSTLLARLAGLEDADGVVVRGRPPEPGRSTRFLPARARDLLLSETVAAELDGVDDEVRRALVPDALLERHPLALSGGEAQRVALASVLGRRADVHLLDEPEAHLDAAGVGTLASLLARQVQEGSVVVLATHHAGLAGLAATTLRPVAEDAP